MTYKTIALRLLAEGPLNMREFVIITGWPVRRCITTLCYLRDMDLAVRERRVWRLA
jgi:hypothetical protein